MDTMPASYRASWQVESAYFDRVTEISGTLKKYDKDERKNRVVEALKGFNADSRELYMPTNPSCKVAAHIPESGTPMQSAAKVQDA